MNVFQDFVLLKSFIAIADAGSISAAANNLNTTQPTISRHLKTIEERLGETLIHRNTHSMQLTPMGMHILSIARELILITDEAEHSLHHNDEKISGHIRLFSTIDFGQTIITRLMASFVQEHSNITFDLSYSNRPLHMIEEGCDIGIVAGSISDQSIVAKHIGNIKRYVVSTPKYLQDNPLPKTIKELESKAWISLGNSQFGHPRKVELYNLQKEYSSFMINPILTCEGVTSMKEALHMHMGIAILPEWLIEKELTLGTFVRIFPEYSAESIPVHIVYPVQKRKPKRLSAFIDFSYSYMKTSLRSSLS